MDQSIILKIKGMHCSSCAMNIDGDLEDSEGIFSAKTSFAKGQVEVEYDPEKTGLEKIKEIIAKTGYKAEV